MHAITRSFFWTPSLASIYIPSCSWKFYGTKIWCLGSFLEMECEKMLLEGTYPVSGGDTPRSCVRRGHTSILVRRGRLDPVSRGHTSILARRGRTSILYQHGREYLGPYVTVWLRCFWGRWEKRRKSMGSEQEAYTSCTSMGLGVRIYGCIYQHRQKVCAVMLWKIRGGIEQDGSRKSEGEGEHASREECKQRKTRDFIGPPCGLI